MSTWQLSCKLAGPQVLVYLYVIHYFFLIFMHAYTYMKLVLLTLLLYLLDETIRN